MDLSLFQSIYIFLAAFVGETFGTMFGGGSFFIQPALLVAEIPANIAVANDITAAAFASVTFLIFSRKEKKQLSFKQFKEVFIWMGPCLIVGALVGGYVLHLIPEEAVKWVIITICTFGLVYMLYQKKKNIVADIKQEKEFSKHWKILAVLAGFGIGFYDGMSAAGSGIIVILTLTVIFRKDMKTTLVMANMLSVISLFSAAIVFYFVGLLSFELLAVMIPACLLSGFFGARIVALVSENILRNVYISLVFILLIYMLHNMIFV
jgi:uncharacterized membrane protein YfcA